MALPRKIFGTACLLATISVSGQGFAADLAQQQKHLTNVTDAAKYKMLPYGIRSGSIIFSPGIGVNEIYDDNIYRDETGTQSDFITVIQPSLAIATDFDLHRLYFRTNASLGYYGDHTSENFQDYAAEGGGRLDLDYNTFIDVSSSYRHAHETRDEADDPDSDKPVEYDLFTQKAGFTRALGIIKLYVEGIYDRFKYDDFKRAGITVDSSGRDRSIYTLTTKLAYEYFPGYNVYVAAREDSRKYDKTGAVDRDSTGTELQAGTDLEITGKVKGDVYVSYLMRNYKDGISDVNEPGFGGSLIWNITGLTSLTFNANRSVQETAYQDASKNLKTDFSVQMDHTLRYNLFLNANAGISLSNFDQLSGNDREDKDYYLGSGIEYMPFNGTSIKLDYRYMQRDSNIADGDFNDNKLILSLAKQF